MLSSGRLFSHKQCCKENVGLGKIRDQECHSDIFKLCHRHLEVGANLNLLSCPHQNGVRGVLKSLTRGGNASNSQTALFLQLKLMLSMAFMAGRIVKPTNTVKIYQRRNDFSQLIIFRVEAYTSIGPGPLSNPVQVDQHH